MQIRAKAVFSTEAKTWQLGETGECSAEQAHRLISDGLAEPVKAEAPVETAMTKAPESTTKKRAPARTIGKPRAQE